MRAIFAAAGLAALLAAPAARADFEGVIEGRMTGQMSGSFRAQVGKAGVRSEVEMGMPVQGKARAAPPGMPGMPQSMKKVTLQRKAEPDRVYLLDEEQKSYTVIDTSKAKEQAQGVPEEQYTVKKTGTDKVAGFSCEKAVVTGSQTGEMEMCLTSEIAPDGARGMLEQGRGAAGLITALRQAGVKGYPVRWSREDGRGGRMTMEVTSARRQSLPASAFELPAGYREAKGSQGMPGMPPGMGGDAAKQMEEAMKRLSPEQRKQMEEMMKGQRGQ